MKRVGKYARWAYSWVPAIPEDCHLCTEISKRRTIMQANVYAIYFKGIIITLIVKHELVADHPKLTMVQPTAFPRIVVATTILFLGLRCDNYSRETTIQGRKLLFSRHSLGQSTEASEVLELTHNHTLIPLPL